jgi:HPt (histidine-containing phosphotransfer) domain-containing protein
MKQRVKEHLCRVYGLGMDDIDELYGIGCQTVGATLSRLEIAFSGEGDAREIADAGHMLKGALFNMGLVELGEMARALEQAGKDGHMEEARAVYGKLRPALKFF